MPARTVHTIQCTQHIISKPAIYPEQFGQTNHAASSIATNIIATNIAQHMCGLISAGSRTLFSGLSKRVPARSYAGVLYSAGTKEVEVSLICHYRLTSSAGLQSIGGGQCRI